MRVEQVTKREQCKSRKLRCSQNAINAINASRAGHNEGFIKMAYNDVIMVILLNGFWGKYGCKAET